MSDNLCINFAGIVNFNLRSPFFFSSDPVYVHQVEVSNLVYSMLSSLKGLWDMKMSAEFVSFQLNSYFKHTLILSL